MPLLCHWKRESLPLATQRWQGGWIPEVLLRVVGGREKLPCLALVWAGELEFCGADAAWAQ